MPRPLRVALSVFSVLLAFPLTVRAQPAALEQSQTTATYKLDIDIGPVATMLMPAQAAGAKEGEVMVPMPGMPMPAMGMTDQGQAVNRHLEVHLFNKASGAVITDQVPTITITNQATGSSRQVSPVHAMYDVAVGQSDLHFGNNVYLPDGTYTVTVAVGGETAQFKDLTISGAPAAAPASGQAMPGMSAPPTAAAPVPARPAAQVPAQLPRTGFGLPAPLVPLGGLAGLLLLTGGLVARRLARQPVHR
jgi:hypothetical protein